MHRNATVTFILLATVLSACSGSGENASPQPIPTASVSGAAVDGLVFNGTVSAYDFSTGSKGALLGQATTNINTGLYSMTIQTESRPLLLELTGGYYYEEMDPTRQVQLDPSDKLLALVNFTTGQAIVTSVTNYTTLAAGLAQYRIANGTAVATAINDANSRISALIGTNVTTTTPREITDPENASAALTPALQYGFLAGGISMWAYNNPPSLALRLTKPYVSIKFIQLMYQDVVADGLLDGVGKDGSGNNVILSFGTKALGANVYRKEIAVNVLLVADHVNNRTGLGSSHVLNFASAYGASTDPIWGGVAPTPITAPVVNLLTPTADQWLRSTINVTATATDYTGLSSAELLVDGNSRATITTGLQAPVFSYNTTAVPDGNHTMGVRVTNILAQATSVVVPVRIDNTPPIISIQAIQILLSLPGCRFSGTAFDSLSGIPIDGIITVTQDNGPYHTSATGLITNGTWTVDLRMYDTGAIPPVVASTNDVAGNTGSASRNAILDIVRSGGLCYFQ
jgi:Bacterial Ig domain